jgi:hypothetical protein
MTYDSVKDLPLRVDSYELERLEHPVSPEFSRVTTVVHLHGGGEEGVGEDVSWMSSAHDAFPELPHSGTRTLDSFSQQLDGLDDLRRWGVESSALDLALRQAGRSLADVLEREPRPLRFVVSTRGDAREWLRFYPALRFKLDAEKDWTDELVAELAATGAVEVVDFKAFYRGTPVDLDPDPVLYRRVAEGLPGAWLEDAGLTPETEPVLAPHRDRLTWDAPIHSVADIEALPFPPRTLNIKPSRFGSVRGLFDALDYCVANGIGMYGGGQFELGPGRGQAQYLASLFYPEAPNDIAPGIYNTSDPGPGLPQSPLELHLAETGFRATI